MHDAYTHHIHTSRICVIHTSYVHHTHIVLMLYRIIYTRSEPGPEVRSWPYERVSTAILAQQSEGWCVGSGTIEADTWVPRAPYGTP
jgi:hypothetical protein